MAIKTTNQTFDVYTIVSPDGQTRASFVPEKGGVGSSLIMPWQAKERELLFQHKHFWQRDNASLPGGWPFIFPICARIERDRIFGNYLYDGELYNLPIHGFASAMPWQISSESCGADKLTLTLSDTPATFKIYPFNFRIELEYSVANNKFTCRQKYTNTGTKPLPYYAGFHPYFLTPPAQLGKEKVILDYQPQRRFRYNERLTDLVGTQELFALPTAITNPIINEQLVELSEDKTISLTFPDGFKITLRADGLEDTNLFRYVQLYTQEQEPFFCIEPWMSFPNALNTIDGPRWLQSGQSEHGLLQLLA